MSRSEGIDLVFRLARRAEARVRVGRALRAAAAGLCLSLGLILVAVALEKVGRTGPWAAHVASLAAPLVVLLAAAVGAAFRVPRHSGARALDRFHGLNDRLASALAFAETRPSEQTAFMRAAIDDGVSAAAGANPRSAVRIPLPRTFALALALASVLFVVSRAKVHRPLPTANAQTIDPVDMAPDDLDDVKDFLAQIAQNEAPGDTKNAIDQFNALVTDIAAKRLDRTEAFRRIEALADQLAVGRAADRGPLERQLETMGEELKKADATRPAGVALANHDLGKARDALHELAKKLREPTPPADKAKLDQVRQALKNAAAEAQKRDADLSRRREQVEGDLLKMKSKLADGGSEDERSLLEKKQRELDRLDRELNEHRNVGRDLDRLDRELDQAAEDLLNDMGQSADDVDQSAEDINHLEQQQMTQAQKEQLRDKLQELKQRMRQQGQGGKPQMARMRRFDRAARGKGSGDPKGEEGREGQEGAGGDGNGPRGEPIDGRGGGGAGENGGNEGETWTLGPDGEKVLMMSKGQGGGHRESPGEGQGKDAPTGRGWGEAHDPNVQGKATNAKMSTQDTQVQGADTTQGASRSQVILGAAERGFASRSYKKVYSEYHQVAEESLAKDEIPGGYRFYVKRYFQLIRPREER